MTFLGVRIIHVLCNFNEVLLTGYSTGIANYWLVLSPLFNSNFPALADAGVAKLGWYWKIIAWLLPRPFDAAARITVHL